MKQIHSIGISAEIVRSVCDNLKKTYGLPRLGNPKNSVDDLIYIILSNKTSPEIAGNIYRKLKQKFRKWEDMLRVSPNTVVNILRPAGLAQIKTSQILTTLEKIKHDFKKVTLSPLKKQGELETLLYLRSLPGVSDKVARCVMMYTMDAQVLPVDAHVHRIATRLGWTSRKRADQCHDELEGIVPASFRYAFHVDCIAHGRAVCRPLKPICENCCINSYCEYYHKNKQQP